MSGKVVFGLACVLVVLAIVATLAAASLVAVSMLEPDPEAMGPWPDPTAVRMELRGAGAPQPAELTVTRARYGAGDSWVDVTNLVRNRVVDNTLSVRAGNDLAGDPIFGEPKTLEVECVVDGQQKSLSVPEGGFLEIPKLDPIGTVDELLALVQRCPAEVGFFGVDLATGKTVEYRPDQPACMASIVKLFTLLEVMSQIRAGRFNPTDEFRIENRAMSIDDALNYMIGLSDNAATNALTARVGYDRVNALPAELAMAGVSDRILPEPGVLDDVLDRRVTGPKVLPADDKLLPQHATARGMVKYFELLHKGELKSPELSADVLAVLDRWPRGFVPGAPADLPVVGKGGSIAWRRIGHPPYDMAGWDVYLRNGDTAVALCMWTEWFPDRMPQELKDKWCYAISDGIASVLLSAAPAAN